MEELFPNVFVFGASTQNVLDCKIYSVRMWELGLC